MGLYKYSQSKPISHPVSSSSTAHNMSTSTHLTPAQKSIFVALWSFDPSESTDKYFKEYMTTQNEGILAYKEAPTEEDKKILEDFKDQFHKEADLMDAVEKVKKFKDSDLTLAFCKYCKSIGIGNLAPSQWKTALFEFFKRERCVIDKIFPVNPDMSPLALPAPAESVVSGIDANSAVAGILNDLNDELNALPQAESEAAPAEAESEAAPAEDESEAAPAEDVADPAPAEDAEAAEDVAPPFAEDDSDSAPAEDVSEQELAEDDSEQELAEDEMAEDVAASSSGAAALTKVEYLRQQLAAAEEEAARVNEEKDTAQWASQLPEVIKLIGEKRSFDRCPFIKDLFAKAPKTKKFRTLHKRIKSIKREVNAIEKEATKKRKWAKEEMIEALQNAAKKPRV